MGRPSIKARVNLDDASLRQRFVRTVDRFRGVYEIFVKPYAPSRSLKANGYYWAAVVTPFFEYLSAQDPAVTCPEQAHEVLKAEFLKPTPIVNPITGEVRRWVPPTTRTLSVEEFYQYVEKCRWWLLDFFDVVTLDPQQAGYPKIAKRWAELGLGDALRHAPAMN